MTKGHLPKPVSLLCATAETPDKIVRIVCALIYFTDWLHCTLNFRHYVRGETMSSRCSRGTQRSLPKNMVAMPQNFRAKRLLKFYRLHGRGMFDSLLMSLNVPFCRTGVALDQLLRCCWRVVTKRSITLSLTRVSP